jgi:hypothetical protein
VSGQHVLTWGPAAIQKDLGTRSAPGRHGAPHVHNWECVAEFTERGFALFVCSDKACGETRTLWQSEIEVLQILEAHEWGLPR